MDIMSYLMGQNSAIKKGMKVEVVTELPTTGETNVIYLVPKQTSGENDVFDEYIYVNNAWELIGSTAIDISGKQDTMQFSTMPTADATTVGKIVQYTGTTTNDYTNGYFYIGINNGGTYSWMNVNVMSGQTLTKVDITTKPRMWQYDQGLYYVESGVFAYANGYDAMAPAIVLKSGNGSGGRTIAVTATGGICSSTGYDSNDGIYSDIKDLLTKTNTSEFTPTNNYNPSTKLYSDTIILTKSGLSAYISSTTYQVGDYVYRSSTDLTIYKCNTADTTGTWNSSKWTQKTYMDYLSDTLVGNALGGSY